MKTKLFLLILGIIFLTNLASALVIDSVSMNPKVIAPGETAELIIELENNGECDAEDVSVVLDLSEVPFAPYNSASEYGIEEIDEGDSEDAEFKLIALNDADAGIYKIPVEITYYYEDDENETEHKKDSLISVTVNSKPIIDVTLENGLLLKGQEKEITLQLTNKGLSNAKFLEIEIADLNSYNILSSNKIYIGDLDSDDFDSVTFDVYFKPNAPDTVTLPVVVRYKDSINNEYTETSSLQLKVYSSEKAIELELMKKNNTGNYIGALVILVVLYYIYKKFKKRKKSL